VKGPGTIGIDTNDSLADVYCTVNEALDYYGIYCVTRPSSEAVDCATDVEEIILSDNHNNDDEGCEEVKDIFEDFSHETVNQVKRHHSQHVKDRQSMLISTIPSIDFLDHKPREPEEVILNRRISMGVYGMFSKFM
jgi:hypothetical protein